MTTTRINRRFGLLGTLILSGLSLCALALPLNSAKAQCLGVDLGFGCAGLGVGSWYTHPYYYGYPTYYGPAYYGYPYYEYPAYTYPSYAYPYYRHDYGYE
jgi:hypothetical protein